MSKTRKNMGQICIILQKFITKQKTEIDDQKNYNTKLSTLCGVTRTSLEIAYCLLKNMGQICIILQKFITKKKKQNRTEKQEEPY